MKKSALIINTIALPLDFFSLLLAGVTAYFLRFNKFFTSIKPIIFNLAFEKYFPAVLYVAVGWILLFTFSGLYSAKPNRRFLNEISRIIFACSTGLSAITIYIFFRGELFNSRFIVLAGWLLAIIFVIIERGLLRLIKKVLYSTGVGVQRTIIIGAGHIADILEETLNERTGFGYKIAGHYFIFDEETSQKIKILAEQKKIDSIILTNPKSNEQEALALIDFCEEYHLNFKYSADLFSTYLTNMDIYAIGGVPIVEMQKTRLQIWGRVAKRMMDLVGGFILFVIVSPFLILTAIAIFLETGRPIIYKNERVGMDGEKFFTLKFRSMYQKYCIGPQFSNQTEALVFEKELIAKQNTKNGPVYKIKNDPRVTKVGRLIRKLSIDELPQIFNVLKGDMSLVGPRPHQPREVERYAKHHRKVLNIKPGVTGLAQISGRSDLEFEDEVRLDTFYVEHWSLIMDLIILFKTPFILFKSRKAL